MGDSSEAEIFLKIKNNFSKIGVIHSYCLKTLFRVYNGGNFNFLAVVIGW
jgi:hypothetical protein